MKVSERYELLKENAACFSCLLRNHRLDQCERKQECGDGCRKLHHKSLHSSAEVDGTSLTLLGGWLDEKKKTVLLPIMEVKTIGTGNINVLWDTAANLSLITIQRATSMNLKGKSVKLSVVLAGGEKKVLESERYFVPLVNIWGQVKYVSAFGIELQIEYLLFIRKVFPGYSQRSRWNKFRVQ